MKKKNYNLSIGEIEGYKVLKVQISGTPGLGTIRELMNDIDAETKKIGGEYISITDFRELNISKLLQSIILTGMETVYKSLLSVANPAKYSFVIVSEDQRESKLFKETLKEINQKKGDKDYTYKYIFVNDESEVPEIIRELEK
ncbi:hypothetical protein JW978_00655 [Candidatus Dojkabacteria bacterium]|nr:hypothetical protein [Candidatus Dojkabacteria bacterium]